MQELSVIFEEIDTDRSGLIDFDEFVTGVAKFVLEKSPNGSNRYYLLYIVEHTMRYVRVIYCRNIACSQQMGFLLVHDNMR